MVGGEGTKMRKMNVMEGGEIVGNGREQDERKEWMEG